MKSKIALLALMSFPLLALADNIIRTSAPILYVENASTPTDAPWISASPSYGSWINEGEATNCGAWLPSADNVDMATTVSQTALCEQTQVRSVQPREQQQGTQNYRNTGAVYEESQVVQVENQRDVRGAVARSCLMHKQYAGATADGIYTIRIEDRDVSVMCKMAEGGWTVVARGYEGSVGNWALTRDAINPGVVPGASNTVTARLSDYDINAIPKTAFKVVTTGYNNTRYFKGSCEYNSIGVASGDCAISYATEDWTSPRGNGLSAAGGGGLCDNRASVSSDGYYVLTSANVHTGVGWAAGNGTTNTNTGTAMAGTRISQYIYVK